MSDNSASERASELLDDAARPDLLAVARALFPHDGLGDGPYYRAVDSFVAGASIAPRLLHMVNEGLRELRSSAAGPLDELRPDHFRLLLEQREATSFFTAARTAVAYALYDDREVWEYIGYPGPAFDLGGYLNRGFNDLDWLPEPRIEESDLPLQDVGPMRVKEGPLDDHLLP